MGEIVSDWRGLGDEELSQYATQGYLHLRGLFNEAEVEFGLEIVDRAVRSLTAGEDSVPYHASYFDEGSRKDLVRVRNAVAQRREVAYFLDHPRLIGPMVSLLGPGLQVLGSEVFYRDLGRAPHEPWHIDGGPAMYDVRIDHTRRSLQAKAQVFLTEVSEPRSGNFLLIPGSHTWPAPTTADIEELNRQQRAGGVPGALTVRAEPGDVLLFPYSLWHAVDCNVRAPRKSLILRFGHLWHRPHDYDAQPREVLDGLSPRLRRMLGDFGADSHPMNYYKPTDNEAVMSSGGDYTSLVPPALIERHGADAFGPASWPARGPWTVRNETPAPAPATAPAPAPATTSR
ncbi:phytanoyl-CoA dioxygenase family protein [Kitasatospora sp. NPDC059577]|uniref:phytanoyl-CoA dioxygenase family protein n=1 Tax=Kitasatospora sp. NPDC059577 TaxID=3346873 RepID=UPI003690C049